MDDSLNVYVVGVYNNRAYISKYDSTGAVVWTNLLGNNVDQSISKLIEFESSNSIIVSGNISSSNGIGSYDVFITKLGLNGELLSSDLYGTDAYDDVRAIAIDSVTKETYIAFNSSKFNQSVNNITLLKLDVLGNVVWCKALKHIGDDFVSDLKLNDNELYISGCTTIDGDKNALLIKLDIEGNIVWSRSYGGAENDEFTSVEVLNGYSYLTGWTESFGFGGKDVLILKLDDNGNWIWGKVVGDWLVERGNKINIINDSIYVSGYMQSKTGTADDMFYLKVDTMGNSVNIYQLSVNKNEYATLLKQKDNRLFVGGPVLDTNWSVRLQEITDNKSNCDSITSALDHSNVNVTTSLVFINDSLVTNSISKVEYNFDSLFSDTTLISLNLCLYKEDTTINDTVGIVDASKTKIIVYPNPSGDIFTVKYYGFLPADYIIYDVMGRQIRREQIFSETFQIKLLPKGIYNLIIENETILIISD